MVVVDQVALFCKESGSDKVYQMQLNQVGSGSLLKALRTNRSFTHTEDTGPVPVYGPGIASPVQSPEPSTP